MKYAFFLMASVTLSLVIASYVRADEKEAKAGEWTVTVGCAHCNYSKDTGAKSCAPAAKTADGKIVLLKGDALKDVKYKEGGEYVVKGKISEDGKSIEVTEIKKKA
ncbi:MAG TPA: hypothetical protein VGP72_06200 [Planctomycetota bacterium]|jgi:hypothetical protein